MHQPNQVKLKMASQLLGMVNPSLHGEGDSGKSNVAWARAKQQKRDGKQELPKVSNTHIGRRVLHGDEDGVETSSRTELVAAWGLKAAAWSLGGSADSDNDGGTPQKKLATSVGNAHHRVPRRGTMEQCPAPGGRLRGAWELPRGARGELLARRTM